MKVLSFFAPGAATAADNGYIERDGYLDGTNGGVHLFDLRKPIGYPSQAQAVNGALVRDYARAEAGAADGAVTVQAGAVISYADGLNFALVASKPNAIWLPASVLASIHGGDGGAVLTPTVVGGVVTGVVVANGGSGYRGGASIAFVGGNPTTPAAGTVTVVDGVITACALTTGGTGYGSVPAVAVSGRGEQYWLQWGWYTLPATTDWNKGATRPQFTFMSSCAATAGPSQANPDLCTLSMTGPGYTASQAIAYNRWESGVNQSFSTLMPAAHHGQKVLVAAYRTAANTGLIARSVAGGTTHNPQQAYRKNAGNFSGCTPSWGVTAPYSDFTGDSAGAMKFKLHRGAIEDLAVTGRDPVAVINAEFDRQVAAGWAS